MWHVPTAEQPRDSPGRSDDREVLQATQQIVRSTLHSPAPCAPVPMSTLTHIRLPLPWDEFDLPNPLATRSTVLSTGTIGWTWSDVAPALAIAVIDPVAGTAADGWDLDHVVLLVPDLANAIDVLDDAGIRPRLRVEVRGRPTAFFRVGPLLEVIESPVRGPAVYGVALVTDEPLEVLALRWRAMGRDVTDPKPAIQPGRRILTVRAVEAGFAVMSPDRAHE